MSDADRVYDVAIVGAGPAGAAAAVAAATAGARVLLLDREDFPRDKTCGDGIAKQGLDVLAGLGVTGVADGYAPIRSLRLTAPGGAEAARPLPEPAYTIPREVFDARLVRAAVAAGAELVRHGVRTVTVRDDRVELGDGICARVVIGADGANSVVRRALGVPRNPHGHLAVALRGYAPAAGRPAEQRIVMTGRRWPAYAWSFPIGDGRRNVGYGELTGDAPLSREHLIARMHELLGDTDPAAVTGLRAHHLPLSTWRPAPGRGRVLLAGDALSLVNPFTGEGIFYAVLSGALAGAAARHGEHAGAAYTRALRGRMGRHLRHTGLIARATASPRVVDAGIRAAARDQRVFDGFVGLGLGDGLLTARLLGSVAGAALRRRQ